MKHQRRLPKLKRFAKNTNRFSKTNYKSKDAFAPFQDNPNENSIYLIDLIHIDETPTEIAEIKAICIKHKSLFKNELGPEPA